MQDQSEIQAGPGPEAHVLSPLSEMHSRRSRPLIKARSFETCLHPLTPGCFQKIKVQPHATILTCIYSARRHNTFLSTIKAFLVSNRFGSRCTLFLSAQGCVLRDESHLCSGVTPVPVPCVRLHVHTALVRGLWFALGHAHLRIRAS